MCPGCDNIIEFGEHGIHLPAVFIFTPMPATVQVRDVPSLPLGEELTFHNGRCLWRWLVTHERIKDSMAEWLDSEKLFLVVVRGTSRWMTRLEFEFVMSSNPLMVHSRDRVRDPDGTERPMNEAEKAWLTEQERLSQPEGHG